MLVFKSLATVTAFITFAATATPTEVEVGSLKASVEANLVETNKIVVANLMTEIDISKEVAEIKVDKTAIKAIEVAEPVQITRVAE